MKTALYVEDGLMQIVLTPETDLERSALEKLRNLKRVEAYKGQFYPCQGGWMRHSQTAHDSIIFVCREQPADRVE